jgi:hypothetical protein
MISRFEPLVLVNSESSRCLRQYKTGWQAGMVEAAMIPGPDANHRLSLPKIMWNNATI